MTAPILEVRQLSVDYLSDVGPLHAVEGLSFRLEKGRSLAIVGESGCGKTTAMLALLRLLPSAGRITAGEVLYQGIDLLRLREEEMNSYRWHRISIVFQGAMNALNPVRKISEQIAEAINKHKVIERAGVRQRVDELMEMVGISAERADQYPHQYSGGMRQRAMIAMALSCSPDVLIADEPTTALDVMVQAQILELLQSLQRKLGLAIIVVTHDLGMVAELCDDVLVMYSGKMAEYGSVDAIYNRAAHPYTQRLLQAFPDVEKLDSDVISIPGYPPPLHNLPPGCHFEPRCWSKMADCQSHAPPPIELEPGHVVACFRPGGH
jgi:oligopeptide/dipeptide ABC transporter ATP-binding protein